MQAYRIVAQCRQCLNSLPLTQDERSCLALSFHRSCTLMIGATRFTIQAMTWIRVVIIILPNGRDVSIPMEMAWSNMDQNMPHQMKTSVIIAEASHHSFWPAETMPKRLRNTFVMFVGGMSLATI